MKLTKVDKADSFDRFREVFYSLYPPLCVFANRLVNSHPDAEDIVENIFFKAWQKKSYYEEHTNIKALLYLSVKNECLNFIKKKKRQRKNVEGLTYYLRQESEGNILNEITRAEVLGELYRELQQLPLERRTVMELLFIKGWDSAKVAEHLGISIHTVKKHKLNGIRDLRARLAIADFALLFSWVSLMKGFNEFH